MTCTVDFLESYNSYNQYPDNLVQKQNARQTAVHKGNFRRNVLGLFRHAENKEHIWVSCRDYGTGDTGTGTGVKNFKGEDDVRRHLGEYVPSNDVNRPLGPMEAWDARKDPKCRVILFESNAPGERCLNTTEAMAKRLLTYHQVPSCYLNLMTFYNHNSALNESYGAFVGQHTLRGSCLPIDNLGRSGRNVHISYALRTTMRFAPDRSEDQRRDGLLDEKVYKREIHDWVKPQAAIHHQFDPVQGTAVWFITTSMRPNPDGSTKYIPIMWKEHLGDLFKDHHADKRLTDPASMLEASLEIHMKLAEWSLGNLSQFIQYCEDRLESLTSNYMDDQNLTYDDKDIQKLGILMDRIALCLTEMKSNRKVINSLKGFYKKHFHGLIKKYDWCDWADRSKEIIDGFNSELDAFMDDLQGIDDRATALKEKVDRREQSISKLLQNQSNKRMHALTKQGQKEAIIVGLFQYIALIFLPVTVVSAIFSTDIVKFQDLTPGETHSYSQEALISWLVTSAGLTILTIGTSEIFKRWKRKKFNEQKEFEEEDGSSDDDNESMGKSSYGRSTETSGTFGDGALGRDGAYGTTPRGNNAANRQSGRTHGDDNDIVMLADMGTRSTRFAQSASKGNRGGNIQGHGQPQQQHKPAPIMTGTPAAHGSKKRRLRFARMSGRRSSSGSSPTLSSPRSPGGESTKSTVRGGSSHGNHHLLDDGDASKTVEMQLSLATRSREHDERVQLP